MIFDVHSHTWLPSRDFSETFRAQMRRARSGFVDDLKVKYKAYRVTEPAETRTVVFGGKARLSGLWIDGCHVAQYIAQGPARVTGFLSVDPIQDGWERELHVGHEELGLRGIKFLLMYAGFMPHDERLDPRWRYAVKHQFLVLLHTGTTFVDQSPLECTLPRHLDHVAIRHPNCKIILARLGHPYDSECVAVIRKHPNVHADISALHYRPFQFYHSLML